MLQNGNKKRLSSCIMLVPISFFKNIILKSTKYSHLLEEMR